PMSSRTRGTPACNGNLSSSRSFVFITPLQKKKTRSVSGKMKFLRHHQHANPPPSKNARSEFLNHHEGHEAHEGFRFYFVLLCALRSQSTRFDSRCCQARPYTKIRRRAIWSFDILAP